MKEVNDLIDKMIAEKKSSEHFHNVFQNIRCMEIARMCINSEIQALLELKLKMLQENLIKKEDIS